MASSSRSDARVRAGLVAAVLAGAILGAVVSLVAGSAARQALFDAWQRAAPRTIAADKVAVVLIDPLSLEHVGAWPWPRYYMARLVEEIAARQPAAIGFDMSFPEADRFNPDNFATLYAEMDAATIAGLTRLPTMDSVFATVLGRAPGVVLPWLGISEGGADPAQLLAEPIVRGKPPPGTPAFPRVLASIPELDDVAAGHGVFNGPPDADGTVRRVPLTVLVGDRPLPGLAVELARIALGVPEVTWRGRTLAIGDERLPADESGRLALRFGTFPNAGTYNAARLFAGEAGKIPADAFAGKVVLIGLGSEGTADLVSTPVGAEGYGVFVQAQAVDAILKRGWLDRPAWANAAEWLAAAILVALLLLTGLVGRRWPLAAAALLAGGGWLAAWLAFDRGNVLLDPLRPLLVGAGAAIALALTVFARARAERARLAAQLVEQRVAVAMQEGELQAARSIQLGMVPSARALATLDPRIEVGAVLKPARQVGGDFYDAVRIDDDRVLFVVGDVTGKGIPAALYMALSKTLTKSVLIRHRGELASTVAEINDELLREADEAMGVTMLIVMLDSASGELEMVNAGHENPILIRAGGAAETLPLEGGPPFCVCEFPYPGEKARLAPGDTLVLITDGVTEAQDGEGALFGLDRTITSLDGPRELAPGGRIEHLSRAVGAFEGDKEASDDLTIMAIRYVGGTGAIAT
ncbi:MAG: CHASE2 domain-containing protein [Novosphingobium sp.]